MNVFPTLVLLECFLLVSMFTYILVDFSSGARNVHLGIATVS